MDEHANSLTGRLNPRGEIRLVLHADGHPLSRIPVDPEARDLYEYVDNLAEARIDVFSLMCFVSGQTLWRTRHAIPLYSKYEPDSPYRVRLEGLWDKGVAPIEAYARRCHEKGLKFLAKFRMNDRHSRGKLSGHLNIHMGPFIEEHQEWWLKTFPGGLDFTHQGVREWYQELASEVTSRFDVDGLTFNYIRYPHVFEPEEGRQKEGILTEFMREVRRMLDREGKNKGRKLLFCVVVPLTIEECHNLGCDLPSWIKEEIVDIVCPCDWSSTTPFASYVEFAELTRERNVYLHPAVHAHLSRDRYFRNLMSPESYRATARNYYAAGADGISAFNFMYHWTRSQSISYAGPVEQYPKAFHYLTELRCAKALEDRDRHYADWPKAPLSVFPGLLDRSRVMTLCRAQDAGAEWTIRCAEQFNDSTEALVRMNAVNLLPDDRVELTVNGHTIPKEAITRTFHEEGRRRPEKGMPLPPYTTLTFTPSSPPFVFLENVIGLKLLESGPAAQGEITVPEIEVGVAVGDVPVLEVMDRMEERHEPPVETLAGYHPDAGKAFLDAQEEGTIYQPIGARRIVNGKEMVSRGAQSFVLKEKTTIRRVDLCVMITPDVEEPIRLAIRRDQKGLPAEEPLNADASAAFNPWKTPEELTPMLLNGYYAFRFDRPLHLQPGTYWLVFEMDPRRQPEVSMKHWAKDPTHPSCYAILLAASAYEHYPKGRYVSWQGSGWQATDGGNKAWNAFFGVWR